MTQLFANNATGSLATSASNSAVTLTLATGQGAKFPSPTSGNHFMLTLVGLDGNGNENAWEIVRVTARSNDVLTVVRGQEGTTAVAWNAGTRVELRATAGTFDTLTDAIEAAAAAPVQSVNGYTGTVVLAKADVGLGNVENKSSATIRSEITSGNVTTALGFTPENPANKGAANGYAPLGADTKIAATYLPSYVDDVLEYANLAAFPASGESGKIYVAQDTNKTYRWSGSVYVEISATAGNADTATKLATARQIALAGDVTGSAAFDGSTNITINTTVTGGVGAKVVGTPVLTGTDSGVIGNSYSLSFSATPYLSGATIASFEVTKPDGSKQTVTASGNAGSYSWPVVGNANDSKTFSVTATDSLGNVSAAAQKTITLVNVSINAPSVTSPANGATNIGNNPTLSTSSFAVTGGSDTHESTDWEIWTGANRTGTLVWSSLANSSNKITIAVPSNAGLQVNTTYHIAVRHKGVTYGYSSYGSSSFTTAASFVPTVFGEAYQGGFYTGKIVVSGQTYALIVSPKASGEHTSKQWKTTNDTTANTLSFNDGLANSNAMNNANHPAAQFCRALSIGGYSDWYLPSMAELELCYRNLKPTTDANYTTDNRPSWRSNGYNVPASNGNGQNSYSNPVGSAYTSGSPAQTSAAAFRTGQSEAFNSAYYWASTEFNSTFAWRQGVTNGDEGYTNKSGNNAVRAVRKVLI